MDNFRHKNWLKGRKTGSVSIEKIPDPDKNESYRHFTKVYEEFNTG